VVLQKPQEQDRLPPPRTLILDFTLNQTHYVSSHVHNTGQLTNTRYSDDTPDPDGVLRVVTWKKILHYYHQLYIDRPEPIAFLSVTVDTSDRVNDDFGRLLFLPTNRETSVLSNSRLLFLYANREVSILANEIPEESDLFRFLRPTC
jgi:hypothetical protein